MDFYLTRVYIGQLLVNRSLYIIHVMRNRSSLNFNQKEEIELLIVQLVANLFIFSIWEVGDYKNCNLKVIGINEIIKNCILLTLIPPKFFRSITERKLLFSTLKNKDRLIYQLKIKIKKMIFDIRTYQLKCKNNFHFNKRSKIF